MVALNGLLDPFIRVVTRDGQRVSLTLPELMARACRDDIDHVVALRPHQQPAFHAFLVQLTVLGCEALEMEAPPGGDPAAWAALFRALTPDHPDDAPWSLVVDDLTRPALLQVPVPEGRWGDYRSGVETPDALDILVTSKNHDLKAARMVEAQPDDWLFALISLQTQEGFMGAGNYGTARMNGGFGSRPQVRRVPASLGWGGAILRDSRRLLEDTSWRDDADSAFKAYGGKALLWLEPWSGEASLPLAAVDALFIDCARRVRLRQTPAGGLQAWTASSKAERLNAKSLNGVLGDPWGPVNIADKKGAKLLTINEEGFGYRQVVRLLSKDQFQLPPCATPARQERHQAMVLSLEGLARGQGKTAGFHHRVIAIPRDVADQLATDPDRVSARAQGWVALAGAVANKALRSALVMLVQKGPAEPNFAKPSNDDLTGAAMGDYQARVDAGFFPALWASLTAGESEEVARAAWLDTLGEIARDVFKAAADAAPRTAERRTLAVARAENLLEAGLAKLRTPEKPDERRAPRTRR